MSIGPLAGQIAASAAGSPLAQTKGGEVERAQHETMTQQRTVESSMKAEAASGIGETDSDNNMPNERDADGRRFWERILKDGRKRGEQEPQQAPKDPTGQTGSQLDLSG